MDELGDFLQDNSGSYDFGDLSGLGALGQAAAAPQQEQASSAPGPYTVPGGDEGGALASAFQDPGDASTGNWDGARSASDPANPVAAEAEKQNPILKALGFKGSADGTSTDFADPKSLTTLLKALSTGGSFLQQILSKGQTKSAQTGAQLQAQLTQNPYNAWNPTQAATANRLFNQSIMPSAQRPKQYASDMQNPIVAGHGYAEGGEVQGPDGGEQTGALGLVAGNGMGQADDVPVNLSGGEWVGDADFVSALGDGNNAAGAKKLDELREAVRRQKRSAPPDEIPPPAHDPMQYMEGH